jgi:lantibiotic modifying enzyme
MAEDLHCENLGFWRKSPVVIDFGSHLVGAAV